MTRNRIFLIALGIVVLIGGLGLLRFTSLRRREAADGSSSDGTARQQLHVGFLPVTCHLTCPVTDFASRTSTTTRFESQRFTDFPTVAESVKAGRLDATFMVVPLAMKLREQGLPIKIVYLGHRDGSTVIVRKDSTAQSLRDLRGKTFAIPTRFS
ncbi:MAG: NitT/TauT family transport system substrate-binding protein, partial [Acidobacteriota bacterium]|nr:NitT/TauT family transport system substrate-binding protein [Acidobacteriota bacterium]